MAQEFQQQKLLEYLKRQQVEKVLPVDDFADVQPSMGIYAQRLAALKFQQKIHYENQLRSQYENQNMIEEFDSKSKFDTIDCESDVYQKDALFTCEGSAFKSKDEENSNDAFSEPTSFTGKVVNDKLEELESRDQNVQQFQIASEREKFIAVNLEEYPIPHVDIKLDSYSIKDAKNQQPCEEETDIISSSSTQYMKNKWKIEEEETVSDLETDRLIDLHQIKEHKKVILNQKDLFKTL